MLDVIGMERFRHVLIFKEEDRRKYDIKLCLYKFILSNIRVYLTLSLREKDKSIDT